MDDLEYMLELLLKCQDCGKTGAEVGDIEETFCPYTEIYDRKEPITVCKNCYKERAYDI